MEVRFVILSRSGKPSKDKRLSLPVVIGRGEGATLRLTEDSVSRRHCEIVDRDGTVVLRDLGSTNGTLLDGAPLAREGEAEVASGGVVQVVGYRIVIEYGSAGTTVAAPAAADESAERKTVPLAETPAVAADEPEIAPPEAAPAGDDGFAFLGAAEPTPAADDADVPQWPGGDAPEPPAGGDLDDFFKSLS